MGFFFHTGFDPGFHSGRGGSRPVYTQDPWVYVSQGKADPDRKAEKARIGHKQA